MNDALQAYIARHPKDTLLIEKPAMKNWGVVLFGHDVNHSPVVQDLCGLVYAGSWTHCSEAAQTVRDAHPFIQGKSGEWLFIEFATSDPQIIFSAAEALAAHAGLKLDIGDIA